MDEIIILIYLAIISYIDLKTREVPDYLSYSLILFGIYKVLFSIIFANYNFISLSFVGLFSIIGYLLYKKGLWGGGDMLILIALSLYFQFPRIIDFAINFLLVSSIYGVISNFYYFSKKVALILILLLPLTLNFFTLMIYFILCITLSSLFKEKIEKSFIKEVKLKDLTWGDWLIEDVYYKGKLILKRRKEGVSLEDLEKIAKFDKKIKNLKVKIKSGIALIPAFLIAFVITIIAGNILYIIV